MDFVEQIAETVSGGNRSEYEQREYGYEAPAQQGPPVPFPWVARWDERDQAWFYVNEQTGERTWERPGWDYNGSPQPQYREEVERQERRHNFTYGAAGVAAGLVGGALLMHEGEKIHDDFERDKYRVEEDVEDFPENAARWTGEKVGEIESIPNRVEDDVDDAVDDAIYDVEDNPVTRWVDRKEDDVEAAYDEGEDEGEYDGGDDSGDDW